MLLSCPMLLLGALIVLSLLSKNPDSVFSYIMQPGGKYINYIMIRCSIPPFLIYTLQFDCWALFLSPWFMACFIGHATSVDLDHVWCVLLTFKVVTLLQIYSSYIHKCLPTISQLLCIASIVWEFFGLSGCYHQCLYWALAQRGPPSCVLAHVGSAS